MVKTTLKIEGMMCGMCEAHICDMIRRTVPGAKKVTASRIRKEASFVSEAPVEVGLLKDAVDAAGYALLNAESSFCEKKGLFNKR